MQNCVAVHKMKLIFLKVFVVGALDDVYFIVYTLYRR
jgi:hypothetical protein